jgi:transcriptional regulator with XRE-family HTH domain
VPISHSKYTVKTSGRSTCSVRFVIGEEIRKARKKAGLSQEELAFRSNVTRNYVSLVELNQHSPTLDTLVRICQALGVKASNLVAKVEGQMGRPMRS